MKGRIGSGTWRLERCSALALGLSVVILTLVPSGRAWADDAPPPPPPPTPPEALFIPLREQISTLPPFLGDTDLKLHFRSYYFNRTKPDDTINEAWAFGGWIGYTSGWLLDTFAMGVTLDGSAPVSMPPDRGWRPAPQAGPGRLLRPGRGVGRPPLRGLRAPQGRPSAGRSDLHQLPGQPDDAEHLPGCDAGGKVSWVEYLGGYLWKIKPRNADEFISMSQQAGAKGSNDGAGLIGVRLTPLEGLRIDLSNQYGVNTFNTFYGEAEYLWPLGEDWKLRVGTQFTDQRAVGQALLAPAEGKYWATQTGGARLQPIYRQLTVTGAFGITGSGNTIQTPWGSYIGYLSLIDQDFDQARQKAVLIGAAYDFSKLIATGLRGNFNFAWGWDAINPSTWGQGSQPGGVRFHRRLSSSPDRGPPAGPPVPLPHGRRRPAGCQDSRLSVPHHHQLGEGPDLIFARLTAWGSVIAASMRLVTLCDPGNRGASPFGSRVTLAEADWMWQIDEGGGRMNTTMKQSRLVAWLLVLALAAPCPTAAQPAAAQPSGSPAPFTPEQMEQLVAPIALYPDPLVAQVLMASTYPLEIVQAARFVKDHKDWKGDQLSEALKDQTWDDSVKSLVSFPEVLSLMDGKLDWTQKLGDAFLASEKGVLDAVQRLRARAQAQGNLKSTPEQTVTVEFRRRRRGLRLVRLYRRRASLRHPRPSSCPRRRHR